MRCSWIGGIRIRRWSSEPEKMLERAHGLVAASLVALFLLAMTGAIGSPASAHSGHLHALPVIDSAHSADAAYDTRRNPDKGSLFEIGRGVAFVSVFSGHRRCQGPCCPVGRGHQCTGSCSCSSACHGAAVLGPTSTSTAPTAIEARSSCPVQAGRLLSVMFRLDRPPKV